MLKSVTADHADESGFIRESESSTPPAKQRVVFRMMTDPNPNHEIAFALRDRAVMNSNTCGTKRRMTFQRFESNRAMLWIRLPEAVTFVRQSLRPLRQ
jgi:hypothetical protein